MECVEYIMHIYQRIVFESNAETHKIDMQDNSTAKDANQCSANPDGLEWLLCYILFTIA